MTGEDESTVNSGVFGAIDKKFSEVYERALHDASSSPITIADSGATEVTELQQADPDLWIRLRRPSMAAHDQIAATHPDEYEPHIVPAAVDIQYHVFSVHNYEGEPGPEPQVTDRSFYAYDDGTVVEEMDVDGKQYQRTVGDGEKADILSIVEQAT